MLPRPPLSLFGATALALLASVACGPAPPPPFATRDVVSLRLLELGEAHDRETTEARRIAEEALARLDRSPDADLRVDAAIALRVANEDFVVPELLYRLRAERTEGVRLELAKTLAHYGNWSGLSTLHTLAANSPSPSLRAEADAARNEWIRATGAQDFDELWRWWFAGDFEQRLAQPEVSLGHRFEYWLRFDEHHADEAWIEALADAGPQFASELADALHDKSVAYAVAAARILERMGPRANVAGLTLCDALNAKDERAIAAARALGTVADPRALDPLRTVLRSERSTELRVAAAQALGGLALPEGYAALEGALAESEPAALRTQAALQLLAAGGTKKAVGVAVARIRAQDSRSSDLERVLATWLALRAQQGNEVVRDALNAWREPAGPPGIALSPQELQAQRVRRLELLDELLKNSSVK